MNSLGKQFVLLGPQGSGKGTQAKVLAEALKVPHISTGDIFRENITIGTDLGKQADAIIKAGKLVPDDITNEVVKSRLMQADAKVGFILDGYPRNLNQVNFLFTLYPDAVAICITLTDDESVRRISGRRMSKSTGAIYHLEFNPPPIDVPADDLIQRADDFEIPVRERLKIYHQQTEPILEFYKQKGKLLVVDGSPSITDVTDSLLKLLA